MNDTNERLVLYALIFKESPLGFEVSESSDGRSAIVTKITKSIHRKNGLRIGSVITEIKDEYVGEMKARQVIKILNSSSIPIKILFRQNLFDITIHTLLPIGFILDRDINGNDAIVSKVYNKILSKQGLKMGCYVYKIGVSMYCDGLNYKNILNIICQQQIPFTITFRKFDIDFSSIESGGKDDNNKLQTICGGTLKNYLSLNTVYSSWNKLINKTSKETMINQSFSIGKQSIIDSPSIERIEFILSFYQNWIYDRENQINSNVYNTSIKSFLDNLQNYDIIQLLNDYKYILNNYNNNISMQYLSLYLSFQLGPIIDNSKCIMFRRNNRNRKTFNFQLYFLDNFDAKEIVIQQQLDKIYSFLMCSSFYFKNNDYYFNKPNDDDYDNKDNDDESTFNHMMKKLEKHKKELIEIRGYDRLKYTKYLTKIEEEKKMVSSAQSAPHKLHHGYQFGYRYHYWNYYKSFDEDWNYFVESKYGNLKDEILNLNISINQWNIVYNKASQLLLMIYCKQNLKARKGFVKDYQIEQDSLIDIHHVMALLFYTNFDFLNCLLRDSYIKNSNDETYIELKERHSIFANFAKLLVESVHVFGDEMSKKEQYMHCIDNEILFAIFCGEFHIPTSVTSKLSVAHTFNGDNLNKRGLMLILGSDFRARNFDLSWISDESHESEKLFIGGQYLEIRSIIDIKTKENYQFYMDAIKIFQTLIDGEYLMHKISNSIISILIEMINNELIKTNDSKINKDLKYKYNIPIFIDKIFNNYCKNIVKEITIRMCYLSSKYISPSLRKYFIGKNDNMLKLDILFSLFPSIQKMRVTYEQNHGIILNQISYEYFLNFLDSYSKQPQNQQHQFQFNELLIRPNDRKSKRIDPMIQKYSLQFKKYGVNMKRETNVFGDDYVCFEKINDNDDQYGYCTVL